MIFQVYKTQSQSSHRQEGVALMLSVLLLAAITAIVFSFTTIVFIELRATGDVMRSEPAFYATLGVTEEALFQYKRYVSSGQLDVPTCFPSNQAICELAGVTIQLPGTQPIQEDDVPRLQTVRAGEVIEIPLYQLGDWTLQYGQLELEAIPIGNSGSLNADLIKINRDGTEQTVISDVLREGDGALTLNIIDGDAQHELHLTNSTNGNFYTSIISYDTDNSTEKGLPFIAQRVLKIVADYAGITRTYKVFIPVP
ncbi:TPA: hypothetical protein DCG61_02510 [Patescibacteria group bacterium]|jgi:hypothetical protein|nr:hypothetical protein [Patescibacteria group bacterium]